MSDPFRAPAGKSKRVREAPAPVVPEGSVKEVLDWVGTDTGRAELALSAETDSDSPRKGLVTQLTKIVED